MDRKWLRQGAVALGFILGAVAIKLVHDGLRQREVARQQAQVLPRVQAALAAAETSARLCQAKLKRMLSHAEHAFPDDGSDEARIPVADFGQALAQQRSRCDNAQTRLEMARQDLAKLGR
ncbi:hypothetical protein IGB42_04157 [Andreprevotia sp. IGB-42]|uniref:hypothetical protein n=1 Tax=Andreprevotia sp. IGB-42 TaxID=2497473 RepID=UPI00135B5D85|nr:hypothetical protein [Andreprevotia sp. IGB-42]KAF0811391.1 hypothetical protein IGB42_04157 [Andreprevotia sp. IGB-42]